MGQAACLFPMELSISLWKYRIGEVYGHTVEEKKEKERVHLQERVEMEFRLYEADPFIVPPRF
jgi:hypothetical protein